MKVKPRCPGSLAVLPLILVLIVWPVSSTPAGSDPAEAGPATAASLLATEMPAKRTFTRTVSWMGHVESTVSVDLTAQTDGRVEAIEVADQAPVEAGQMIVRLGGAQIETERARRIGQVASLTTLRDLSRQTVARLKEGLQAQLVTREQVTAAQETLVKLDNQLHQFRLDLESFERQSRVMAPVSGIFTQRTVGVGQEVRTGQVIGTLIDPSRLRIVASMFPPPGFTLEDREVSIRLDQTHTLSGRIRAVLPEAGETGATLVWIEGSRVEERLRPGQTLGGDLVLEAAAESLAVPEAAIVYDEEEHPCLFVRVNGAYKPLRVELGLSQDGWVEVLSGLAPEQPVVIQGAYELFYRQFNQQFKVPD